MGSGSQINRQVNVSITGDASSLEQVVRSTGQTLRDAFEQNVGTVSIFDTADKQLTGITEKIKFVKEQLEELKKREISQIDTSGATNAFGKNAIISRESNDINKRYSEVEEVLRDYESQIAKMRKKNPMYDPSISGAEQPEEMQKRGFHDDTLLRKRMRMLGGGSYNDSMNQLGYGNIFRESFAKGGNLADQIDIAKDSVQKRIEREKSTFQKAFGETTDKEQRDKLVQTMNERMFVLNRTMELLKKTQEEHTKALKDGVEDENGSIVGGGTATKTGFFQNILRSGLGGGGGMGMLNSAVNGQGGLTSALAAGGMSMGSAALIGGGIVAAVGILVKGVMDGIEVQRSKNKIGSIVGYENAFVYNQAFATGMTDNEFRESMYGTARSRGTGEDINRETFRRGMLKNAYGVQEGDIQPFDRFRLQGASTPTAIVADILKRSEQKGLLGVDGKDFARLPQILEATSGLLQIQKANSEKVDDRFATSLTLAGKDIGGRFADERLPEVFSNINSGISNPQSGGMRSYIFQKLLQKNPNMSFVELLAKMQEGATSENLEAVMPDLMGANPAMREQLMLQFGTPQDALRLSRGGMGKILEAAKNRNAGTDGYASGKEVDDIYDKVIQTRSESTITNWDGAKAAVYSALGEFWNDIINGRLTPMASMSGKATSTIENPTFNTVK